MNPPISEAELHAYADGKLDKARLLQVETWLSAHPERREEIDAWRAQAAKLHRSYDALLDEPIPAHLMPPANESHWLKTRHFAAAACLMIGLTLGSVIGFIVRGEPPHQEVKSVATPPTLAHMAAVAHIVYTPEVRHPVEVAADQEAHLIAWLSKRLGAQLKPPQLNEANYQLIGGRLLPGNQGEVAQFMYENQDKMRLTLYIQPQVASKEGMPDASFRYANENGVDVFYWTEGRFGYALSGKSGREEMLKLATLVYRQLNPYAHLLQP